MEAIIAKTTGDLKQTESERLQRQELEAIGRLAAEVAHEINAPTQYVSDNVGYLSKTVAELLELVSCYQDLVSFAKTEGIAADLVAKISEAEEEADLDFLREEIPNAAKQAMSGISRIATIVTAMKEFSHPREEGQDAG